MKRIFLAATIILAGATATFAHNNIFGFKHHNEAKTERRETRKELRREHRLENRDEVSNLTKNQFAIDFPKAKNVRFVKTNDFDQVLFTSGKKKMKAYYDHDNELVGTTQTRAFADLPQNAQKEILKKYAGYTPTEVIKFDDNEINETDMVMYGTSFNDEDNYFVDLQDGNKQVVVKVDLAGRVSFFKEIK